MCGVPTKPCMQVFLDWEDCKCSSIDAIVPYLNRVIVPFRLLTLSLQKIKRHAAIIPLSAALTVCGDRHLLLGASNMRNLRRALRCTLVRWVNAFAASARTPCIMVCFGMLCTRSTNNRGKAQSNGWNC